MTVIPLFSAREFRRFRSARKSLAEMYKPQDNMAELGESCIPSYTHPNLLMGWIAWQRLVASAALNPVLEPGDRVLDFGAGSGIMCALLDADIAYDFVERDEELAKRIVERFPAAKRVRPDEIEQGSYTRILALDSLEHNENVEELVVAFRSWLKEGGDIVLSGPTENILYRIGRWLAGFSGDYHFHTIFDIEEIMARHFRPVTTKVVPLGIPLFRITSWQNTQRQSDP